MKQIERELRQERREVRQRQREEEVECMKIMIETIAMGFICMIPLLVPVIL